MKKWLIPVILLLVAGAAYVGFRMREPEPDSTSLIRVSGNIELTEVDIAFKIPGKLTELLVREGDPVRRGDVIAKLEQAELLGQLDRANAVLTSARSRLRQLDAAIEFKNEQVEGQVDRSRAELAQVEAVLREMETGSRQQEIEASRAALMLAEAEHERAERDWSRAEALYEDEDISTAQHDDFRSRYQGAVARLRETGERLELVEEGPRSEDIDAARAQVDRARANLRLSEAGRLELRQLRADGMTRQAEIQQAEAEVAIAETRLEDTEVVSPIDGVVLVKAAETGEVIAGGMTLATIGDLARPWLRAYINETDLGRVQLGTEVRVTTDSFPDKSYPGRISFIASEAEFTPKQIQTEGERVKLVYRIKIDMENPNGELKSNMPADAEIPTGS